MRYQLKTMRRYGKMIGEKRFRWRSQFLEEKKRDIAYILNVLKEVG